MLGVDAGRDGHNDCWLESNNETVNKDGHG